MASRIVPPPFESDDKQNIAANSGDPRALQAFDGLRVIADWMPPQASEVRHDPRRPGRHGIDGEQSAKRLRCSNLFGRQLGSITAQTNKFDQHAMNLAARLVLGNPRRCGVPPRLRGMTVVRARPNVTLNPPLIQGVVSMSSRRS